MTISQMREIIDFAREMMRTLADGVRRAAHYLKARGFDVDFARWALLGA